MLYSFSYSLSLPKSWISSFRVSISFFNPQTQLPSQGGFVFPLCDFGLWVFCYVLSLERVGGLVLELVIGGLAYLSENYSSLFFLNGQFRLWLLLLPLSLATISFPRFCLNYSEQDSKENRFSFTLLSNFLNTLDWDELSMEPCHNFSISLRAPPHSSTLLQFLVLMFFHQISVEVCSHINTLSKERIFLSYRFNASHPSLQLLEDSMLFPSKTGIPPFYAIFNLFRIRDLSDLESWEDSLINDWNIGS